MTSLRELQRSFVDAVLTGAVDRIGPLVHSTGIAPERRVGIYRNNAVEGFLKTMRATFPVVAQLSGDDWFAQTARLYMRRHPSRSGNVHYVGQHFAAFLDVELKDTEFGYFADMARLEWAYQEVLIAADHPSFDIAALSSVAPDDYGTLRFQTHPALRLVESRYPVLAIWKGHQPGGKVGHIHLDSGPSDVLILRRDDHVELRELPPAQFALLDAFARGATFAEAADAALQADAAIDLGAALARVAQLGTLVDFSIPTPTDSH